MSIGLLYNIKLAGEKCSPGFIFLTPTPITTQLGCEAADGFQVLTTILRVVFWVFRVLLKLLLLKDSQFTGVIMMTVPF